MFKCHPLFAKKGKIPVVAFGAFLGELRKRWQLRPVFLLVLAIYLEVFFQCLVDMFSLAITFGVIS